MTKKPPKKVVNELAYDDLECARCDRGYNDHKLVMSEDGYVLLMCPNADFFPKIPQKLSSRAKPKKARGAGDK